MDSLPPLSINLSLTPGEHLLQQTWSGYFRCEGIEELTRDILITAVVDERDLGEQVTFTFKIRYCKSQKKAHKVIPPDGIPIYTFMPRCMSRPEEDESNKNRFRALFRRLSDDNCVAFAHFEGDDVGRFGLLIFPLSSGKPELEFRGVVLENSPIHSNFLKDLCDP